MLRTHRNLEAYCATLWWRWSVFSFFRVMEHRWNENDRGKQKYSGEKMHQCHFVHQKSHMDLPGIFFFFTNSWVFPFDPFLSCINPFSSFRVSNGPQPSFYNTTQTSMPPVALIRDLCKRNVVLWVIQECFYFYSNIFNEFIFDTKLRMSSFSHSTSS